MNKILYKSLPEDKAPNGHKFALNKWYKEENIKIYESGFHASENIIDAMGYVNCFWIAKVEVRGESDIEDDKQCWSEMRIIEWKKWTKKDSVALAIYSAELVIDIYEKEHPNDKRPREAIEAAKRVLKSDTEKNRSAAWSAARSAESAARGAARSAEGAAWSAARSAWSAAWSAESAAWSAARSAESAADEIKTKCHNFVKERKGL